MAAFLAPADYRPVRNDDGTYAVHDARGEMPGYETCDSYADALGHIAELTARGQVEARDEIASLADFEAQHFAEAA